MSRCQDRRSKRNNVTQGCPELGGQADRSRQKSGGQADRSCPSPRGSSPPPTAPSQRVAQDHDIDHDWQPLSPNVAPNCTSFHVTRSFAWCSFVFLPRRLPTVRSSRHGLPLFHLHIHARAISRIPEGRQCDRSSNEFVTS